MHVKVQSRLPQKLTPALNAYVSAKLVEPLDTLCQKLNAHIAIELCDEHRERKGPHRECRVVVMLPQRKPVVIHELDDNMYEAIDKAENRVLVQVKRELARRGSQHAMRVAKRRERARTARFALTSPKEVWERELAEFEGQQGGLGR